MSRQKGREYSDILREQALDLGERATWWDVWTTDERRLARRGYRSGTRAEIGIVRALNLSQDLFFANRSLGAALGGTSQIGVRVLPVMRALSVTSNPMIALGAALYRRRRDVEGTVMTVGDESVVPASSLIDAMRVAVRESLGMVFVWSGPSQDRWLLAQWARSLEMACVTVPRDDVVAGLAVGTDACHLATGMREPTIIILEEDEGVEPLEIPTDLEARWKAAANDALTSPRVSMTTKGQEPRRNFGDCESRPDPSLERDRTTVGEAYRRAVLRALSKVPELVYIHGETNSSPLDSLDNAIDIPGGSGERLSAGRGAALGGGAAIVSVDAMNDMLTLLDDVTGPLMLEVLGDSVPEIGDVPIVAPSTPRDLVGLFETLLLRRGPSVMMIDPWVARNVQGSYDSEFRYLTPLSKASVVAQGSDVGIVTWGRGVAEAKEAAGQLDQLSVGILDVRTLVPLDRRGIAEFVTSTGRVLVLEGGNGSVAGEIVSNIVETCFGALKTRPARLSVLRATRDMVAAAVIDLAGQAMSPPS